MSSSRNHTNILYKNKKQMSSSQTKSSEIKMDEIIDIADKKTQSINDLTNYIKENQNNKTVFSIVKRKKESENDLNLKRNEEKSSNTEAEVSNLMNQIKCKLTIVPIPNLKQKSKKISKGTSIGSISIKQDKVSNNKNITNLNTQSKNQFGTLDSPITYTLFPSKTVNKFIFGAKPNIEYIETKTNINDNLKTENQIQNNYSDFTPISNKLNMIQMTFKKNNVINTINIGEKTFSHINSIKGILIISVI